MNLICDVLGWKTDNVLTKNFSKKASTFDSEESPSKNSSASLSLSCSTSVLDTFDRIEIYFYSKMTTHI